MRIDETLPTTSQFYNNSNYDAAVANIGTTFHYPFYNDFLGLTVNYTADYSLTQMPIPTLNTPFLLNFSGPSLAVSFNWSSITQSDVAFLLEFFTTANPSAVIVIDVTKDWGASSSTNNLVTEKYNFGSLVGGGSGSLRFVGVVDTFTVEEKAGQVLWTYQMSIKLGKVEG
ncbi:MAG: hypothetical protein QXL94_00765 [Candidatus Parvarchaeum sp.]